MADETTSRGRLVVIGDIVEDIIVWLDEPIRPATDTASRVFRARGGSAANVAALAAARWPTRFIGCVGPDAAGDALETSLRTTGVEPLLQRRGVTGTVVLLIDLVGERTMFPDRGASALLSAIDPAWLVGAGHVHVPGYGFEREPLRSELVALLQGARGGGATTSIDASSTGLIAGLGSEAFVDTVRSAAPTWLIANAAEAAMLELTDAGAAGQHTTIVIKDGPAPTRVLAPGAEPLAVPVAPVSDIRDLTGAGDAFAAGFITATLGGSGLEDACRAGHALAASVLTSPGASIGT